MTAGGFGWKRRVHNHCSVAAQEQLKRADSVTRMIVMHSTKILIFCLKKVFI